MSDESAPISLPDDVQALLDEGSGFPEVSAHARARLWHRLDETLDLGGLEAPGPSTPDDTQTLTELAAEISSGGQSAALSLSRTAAALWTASTFALGTLTGVGTHAVLTQNTSPSDTPSVRILSQDMSSPDHLKDMSHLSDMPDMAAPERSPDLAPTLEVHSVDQGKPETSTALSAPGRSLEAERLLLTRAQRALAKSDSAEALKMIDQHERTFGSASSLAEERDFLRIRALLLGGRENDLTQRVDAFTRRYPQSIFLDSLPAQKP